MIERCKQKFKNRLGKFCACVPLIFFEPVVGNPELEPEWLHGCGGLQHGAVIFTWACSPVAEQNVQKGHTSCFKIFTC